jgi:hypothetical protein
VVDKHIQLNQLIFQRKKILPIRLACLSFQLLIHIMYDFIALTKTEDFTINELLIILTVVKNTLD